MDSIINTFHIDLKVMLAQIVNFGIVFVVLYLFALKPMMKIMRERTQKIEKGLADAKENEKLLNNTQNDYRETIAKAKSEAHELFQTGKKEAEAKARLMLAEAEKEVSDMIANGKKTLEAEKSKMLSEVKNEIATLAVKIAEKLVAGKIDGHFDEKTAKEMSNL